MIISLTGRPDDPPVDLVRPESEPIHVRRSSTCPQLHLRAKSISNMIGKAATQHAQDEKSVSFAWALCWGSSSEIMAW